MIIPFPLGTPINVPILIKNLYDDGMVVRRHVERDPLDHVTSQLGLPGRIKSRSSKSPHHDASSKLSNDPRHHQPYLNLLLELAAPAQANLTQLATHCASLTDQSVRRIDFSRPFRQNLHTWPGTRQIS